MKPSHFELHNFCQYGSARFDYEPGVSVFCAENGFGKTNLWDVGQFFSWTGTIPGGTSKQDVLKWGEKKGGASFVFEMNGTTYTLSWAVPGNGASMAWVDKQGKAHNLAKAGDIRDKLESDVFNMPLRMLRDVCFVAQGSFASTITDKAARTEYFSRITDVRRFTDMRDKVVKLKGKLPVYPDVEESIESRESELKAFDSRIPSAKTEIESEEKAVNDMTVHKDEASSILKKPTNDEAAEKVRTLEEKLQKLNLSPPSEKSEPKPPRFPEELPGQAESLATYWKRGREIEQRLQGLAEPEKPELSAPLEDLKVMEGLQPIAQRSKAKGQCLVCSSKLTEEFDADKSKNEAEVASKELKNLNQYEKDLAGYEKLLSELQDELKRNREEETALETRLKEFKGVSGIKEEEGCLLVTFDTGEAKSLADLNSEWSEFRRERDVFLENEKALHQYRVEKEKVSTALANEKNQGTVSSDQKTAARGVLDAIAERERGLNDMRRNLMELEAEKKACERSLADLREQDRLRKKTEKNRSTLEAVADVLKTSRLPRRVMQPFLAPYNRRLGQYLQESEVDYSCRMTADFEYEFNSGDGWKSANRMSGGQLGNLAMSAQLAKMDVVSFSCPLLVLDEPTYGLDEERKQGMVRALQDLNAKEKGLYIMVVSHDPLLQEAADRLIVAEDFKDSKEGSAL